MGLWHFKDSVKLPIAVYQMLALLNSMFSSDFMMVVGYGVMPLERDMRIGLTAPGLRRPNSCSNAGTYLLIQMALLMKNISTTQVTRLIDQASALA